MVRALNDFKVEGIHTTLDFQRAVLAHPDFAQGLVTTRWVEEKFMKQAYT
jgi:biotin carboxylase